MTISLRVVAPLLFVTVVGVAAQNQGAGPADELYAAIRTGNVGQVKALVQTGADVNVRDRRGGATPLMHAAALGSLETVQLLIERGADVNARSTGGATALMWAATDLAKIKLLLDRGADVNAVSESGRSVLLLAAMSDRSADIVRLLLARGADPRLVDKDDKITTLLAATVGNDPDTIRQFVDAGVDVNAADAAGTTPLMNAAGNGNLAAVKLLLAKGAKVNAVSGEPGEVVKNGIIQLGRFTPLLLASVYGPVDVVNALIAAGTDVNARDARGMTPLMLAQATDHGDVAISKALLAAHADPNARRLAGETAMDWAQKSGSTSFVKTLSRAGATAVPPAAHAIPDPAPSALRPAVERGVALLERSSGTFFANGACGACHAQNVTDIAARTARRQGIAIDDGAAAQRFAGAAGAFGARANKLLERFDGPALDILLYALGGFAAGAYSPDRATDALVVNVAAQQLSDGRWHIGGIARPPIEDGDFSRTALGIRALTTYAPPGRGQEMSDRIRRAMAWLQAAKPLTSEDRSFRLLGLAWGGAQTATLRRTANDSVATQRVDGGWAQRDEMTSDAYATGLTVFGLREKRDADDCRSRHSARREIPALDATRRRVVVRAQPVPEVSALLRGRFSVRSRSVDFVHGDWMGDCRARDSAIVWKGSVQTRTRRSSEQRRVNGRDDVVSFATP